MDGAGPSVGMNVCVLAGGKKEKERTETGMYVR